MKIPLKIPIVLRVKIIGPKDFREIDMILDTGARYSSSILNSLFLC